MFKRLLSFSIIILFASFEALSNNVSISNVTLTGQDVASDFTLVQFDITWENSWRDATNYDAVWIFVKYQASTGTGGDGLWRHASLSTTGADHTAPSGSEIITPSDGIGVFLQRDANGTGTSSFSGVQLRWEYGSNNEAPADVIDDDDDVTILVQAVEMVYIPQAAFDLSSTNQRTVPTYYFPD